MTRPIQPISAPSAARATCSCRRARGEALPSLLVRPHRTDAGAGFRRVSGSRILGGVPHPDRTGGGALGRRSGWPDRAVGAILGRAPTTDARSVRALSGAPPRAAPDYREYWHDNKRTTKRLPY